MAQPRFDYGMAISSRYYFLNALEMLDAESEYYIDRESGLLYFIPPGPAAADFRGDAFISASGRHPEGWQPGTLKTDDSRVEGQQPPRSVPLRNAAAPGMTMPLAGLGMPCGPTTCKIPVVTTKSSGTLQRNPPAHQHS